MESQNNQKTHNVTYKTRTHIPVESHSIEQLRELPTEELLHISAGLNMENPQELKRQDLMFEILKTQINQGGYILFTGILEIKDGGFGFLRAIDGNFSDTSNDSYVSATQIKRFALRIGDIVTGQVRPPNNEKENLNKSIISCSICNAPSNQEICNSCAIIKEIEKRSQF